MSEQAKPVFHYECSTPDRLSILTDKGTVVFRGGQYTTDEPKLVKAIEESKSFKQGKIWRSNGVIAGANSGKVSSGARGTRAGKKSLTPDEKLAEMKAMGLSNEVIEAAKKELKK